MQSTRYAALLALGYMLLAAVYIVVSSGIAAQLSASVEQMKSIETFKGVLYVVVTAIGVFLGARYAFARLERMHGHLAARDRAIVENERRVFAGLIAGTIAHDANNVLVAVIADLESLRHFHPSDDETVKRLQVSVERLIALNQRLLVTARRGRATRPEDVDLVPNIEETLAVARSHAHVRSCRVEFVHSGPVRLHTHGLLVQQILSNLVVNAAEATAGRGRIEVRLSDSSRDVTIEVHDDGPGVPADRREHIFDSLESTKPDGSGMGLFSVRSCVAALGGSVEVGESPLGGACFRVHLPEMPREAPGANGPGGPAPFGAPVPGSSAGRARDQSPRT
jgi:signal transduction histidine kinase